MRAFVFDAYGTLFDVYSVTALCDQLFPGNGTALAQMWRAKQLQYSVLRSLMDRYADFARVTEDALVYSAAALKVDLTAEKRSALMDAYMRLEAFPDVKPALRRLKSMGLRLAILSNGSPAMLQAAAKHAGIAELLADVISVDEVRVFKPSPRVYALASTHLHLPESEIGFVSSNNWDVNGAGAAGMTTFWIQRGSAEPQEALGHPATHVVQALTDLVAMIR